MQFALSLLKQQHRHWIRLATMSLFLIGMVLTAPSMLAQTTGDTPTVENGEDSGKEKKKKEKKEKPPKEKKEKKEKPPKEKKSKKEKEPKEKKKKDKKKKDKKKKKGKKGEDEANEGDGSGDGDAAAREAGDPGDEAAGEGDPDGDAARNGSAAGDSIPPLRADSTIGVEGTGTPPIPCSRYHVGNMDFVDSNFYGVTIKRTKRKEIHLNEKTETKEVFKITWTSDCEYTLTCKKAKGETRFRKGWEMHCTIVQCYREYYDADCSLNGIVQYASIRKAPTAKELEAARLAEEEAQARHIADSVKAVMAAQNGGEEPAEGDNARQAPDGDDQGDGAAVEEGKKGKKKKDKKKKDKGGKDKKKGKSKKDKGGKEKKEKKEKPPKEKKEKKQKEPKAEKPPKEKKPKKDKSDGDSEDEE